MAHNMKMRTQCPRLRVQHLVPTWMIAFKYMIFKVHIRIKLFHVCDIITALTKCTVESRPSATNRYSADQEIAFVIGPRKFVTVITKHWSHWQSHNIFLSISVSLLWRICSRHYWAAARWARPSACATQQYCGSVSFVSAHGPLLHNACACDVTQQCVGITWHVFLWFAVMSDNSRGYVTCFLWCVSVPRLYNKVPSITVRQSTQLAVRDSHGKFVVEEELGVSLWRFNVWFEDFKCAVVQWYWECVI
jgi:hypothetical protein